MGMTELEKVKRGLECICDKNLDLCEDCEYADIGLFAYCTKQIAKDALVLLERLEPVKPVLEGQVYHCSGCGYYQIGIKRDGFGDKFCPGCGRPVNWDEKANL